MNFLYEYPLPYCLAIYFPFDYPHLYYLSMRSSLDFLLQVAFLRASLSTSLLFATFLCASHRPTQSRLPSMRSLFDFPLPCYALLTWPLPTSFLCASHRTTPSLTTFLCASHSTYPYSSSFFLRLFELVFIFAPANI